MAVTQNTLVYTGLGATVSDFVTIQYVLAFGIPDFCTLEIYEEGNPSQLLDYELLTGNEINVYNRDPITGLEANASSSGNMVVSLITPKEDFVRSIKSGNVYKEQTLVDLFTQAILLSSEVQEGRFSVFKQVLDMGNNKVSNVADGVDDLDAVNVSQLDAVKDSIISATLPDGTYGDVEIVNSGSELNVVSGSIDTTKLSSGGANAGEILISNGDGTVYYGTLEESVYNTYTETFTATEAQTTFTLSNVPALTSVWINGASQTGESFNVTGSDVVVASRTAGDTVTVTYTTGIIGTVTGTLGSLTDVDSIGATLGQYLVKSDTGYELIDFPLDGATDAESIAGVVTDKYVSPSNLSAMQFQSSNQTGTAGGLITVAHGLGVEPTDISLDLYCSVANNGFSIGDVLKNVDISFAGGGSQPISAIWCDDSNIYIRTQSTAWGASAHKTTAVSFFAFMTDWKLIIKARV